MMALKRIYLSPSNQIHNTGQLGYNEAIAMRLLAEKVASYLRQSPMFQVRISGADMDLYQVCKDSDDWGADVHYAMHSDAFSNPISAGTTVFVYELGGEAERIAKISYRRIGTLSPGTDRGIKVRKDLIELNSTDAEALLIENFFHTNLVETKDFQSRIDTYAKETAMIFYEAYGVPFPEEKPPQPTQPHWAEKYYTFLTKKGIKISDKRFDDKITRGEVFALMARQLGYKE
jgi:N-acetylmuramoyl-L-alanine amidase